ncbi:MAG: 3D domain-containing protein [Firmicutes bacterium]|nr:3D domain-containing protein [Bacillota bacterium]
MTVRQLLLVTTLILALTLRTGLTLRGQVQQTERKVLETRQELAKAREMELESEKYEVQLMNISMYAPLSADAIQGHDYSGDPSLTASGEKLVPGETAASGPNIPFGTEIYVEGLGWHTVLDRGSAVGPNDIDLAVKTTEESIQFGQQERLVIIKIP